jgi:hypothetical protein
MSINIRLLGAQKYHGEVHCKAFLQKTHIPVVNTCTAMLQCCRPGILAEGCIYIKGTRPIESVYFDDKPRKPEEDGDKVEQETRGVK